MMRWVVALAAIGVAGLAHGQPLTVEDVRESAATHHPVIMGAMANARAAEGQLLTAQGGFDPKLEIATKLREGGYYAVRQLDAELQVPTAIWGAEFSAGYRYGQGADDRWPSYSDAETLDAGEIRAGVKVPLWRDGPLDKRRANRRAARQGVVGADASLEAERLALVRKAELVFWKWSLAAQALTVAQTLETLADKRLTQLEARIEAGLSAPVDVLEARRSLLSRREKRISAQRKFEAESLLLSLFYRDRDGRPVMVGDSRPPTPLPQPEPLGPFTPAYESAVACHPRLQAKRAKLAGLGVKLELAEARVAPKLDLKLGVARDLGEGDVTLPGTVFEGQVVFSMPLALRSARGDRAEARARIDAQARALQYDEEKLAYELRDVLSQFNAAGARVVAQQALAQAATELAEAERKRFAAGATNLMVVNLREQSMAAAEVGVAKAQVDQWQAAARWLALTTCPQES